MKLPEKEWLTLEEVAERWRTDVDRIEHYLITGTLKPCLRQGRELLQIENYHDMQWDWSHMADDSFCDLAKCKIQLTCKDSDAVRWSGDPKVCEDDLLIALNEVQRFEKACNADTDSYFEAKRLRKQQIDVLPSVLGVRSASSIASSDLGSAKQDSELDVSADIPRQAASHNIVDVPVESLVVPLAPPADEVEQGEEVKADSRYTDLRLLNRDERIAEYTEKAKGLLCQGKPRREAAESLKRDGATHEMIGMILTNDGVNRGRSSWEQRSTRLLSGKLKGFV